MLDQEANEGQTVRSVTQRTRKDGTLVDVDLVGGPVTVGGELVAKHVFYHDITELQEQKRYFQSLLELSPAAVAIRTSIRRWSVEPIGEMLFGSADEALAARPTTW